MKTKIYNSEGKEVILNAREAFMATQLQETHQKMFNALGLEVPITTLTTVIKKITEQKFFEIAPSEVIPVRAGEGAWSTNLVTFRSFTDGGDFEDGIYNLGVNNAKQARVDAAVDSVSIKVNNWVKSIGWTLAELNTAAREGNWDLVTEKEKARKKNFDLGVQRIAFLGAKGDSSIAGLYTMSGITKNTSVITKPISSMTPAELKAFIAVAYEAYRSNCARTAKPTHFAIPESDFNGLASQASPDFPIKSTLVLLEEAFQAITGNKQFKIVSVPYGDKQYSGLAQQMYVMLNYDDASLRMDVPVAYTSTLANSIDNFHFQNSAYAQFTGVQAYRPLEVLYFAY